MNVNHVVELPNGAVEFKGNLSPKEVAFLIEFSINHLLAIGALPFVEKNPNQLELDLSGTTNTVQ
jgi:hypothetical protein